MNQMKEKSSELAIHSTVFIIHFDGHVLFTGQIVHCQVLPVTARKIVHLTQILSQIQVYKLACLLACCWLYGLCFCRI